MAGKENLTTNSKKEEKAIQLINVINRLDSYIEEKARYLAHAYRIAIEEMSFKTWNECCREAINQLANVHIFYIKNEKVLQRWNVEFCQRKRFCVKNRGKRDLPAFLEAHPIGIDNPKGNKQQIKDMAQRTGISLTY